jgi:hypothetical protein
MSDFRTFGGVFKVNLGVPPDDVPKVASLPNIPLVANQPYRVELRDLVEAERINTMQSVYVDNDNAARVVLQVEGASAARIIVQAYSQGWFPLPIADEVAFTLTAPAGQSINLLIANVAIIAGPWKTQ